MNISGIVLGTVMICIGIFIVVLQIKRFKTGIKDELGFENNLLAGGIGCIVIGIILLVKTL
jgi:hypothetical protein